MAEPSQTALLLAVFGILLTSAIWLSRTLGRRGVPVVIIFMLLGMLAGSEGLGGIAFEDYELTYRLGTVALVLILFDGGLHTSWNVVRQALLPAATLATVGVALTAGTVAVAANLLGFGWPESFLLGAVVSSTDAAAVFSVLRTAGVHLKQRVAAIVELESGLNDPMAVILTLALTDVIVAGAPISWGLGIDVITQLAIGVSAGWGLGMLGVWMLRQPPLAGGLYPVLTLALAALAYGLTTLILGSGFLAVYVVGMVLGNASIPHRSVILRAHDFVAWFAQVAMFITLGLVSFPSELLAAAPTGLVLAAALVVVARPLAAFVCLLPFRLPFRETVYVSWVGLRGAVPIVLATIPLMSGVPQGATIFNVVFFVVVVSVLIQGMSVGPVTRLLGLHTTVPPPAPTSLELTSAKQLNDEVATFFIQETSPVAGVMVKDITFPDAASVLLVVRGETLIAPRGETTIRASDYVSVFYSPSARAAIHELFESDASSDSAR